jgi:hypothetical protein
LAPSRCRSTVNWRVLANTDEQASCEDASVDVVESVVVRRAAARDCPRWRALDRALANGWITINLGGGPTEDKPTVTLEPPAEPDRASAFLNIRVADIAADTRSGAPAERSS